jgi:NADPH:quinone reductase
MRARVLAVASGEDGVALAKKLGADAVADGHRDDLVAAARDFEPGGLDAALLTSGGEPVQRSLAAMRSGGRIAFPNGVEPEPQAQPGLTITAYDGMTDQETLGKLNRLIEAGSFEVHIARAFPLAQAADAHRALDSHYLGKLVLHPGNGERR